MIIRELARDEIDTIWGIDRREIIETVYYVRDGALVPEPEYYDMTGWPPGEADLNRPLLSDCFDRGGAFYGAFEGAKLVGAAVLESSFIGKAKDRLQPAASQPLAAAGLRASGQPDEHNRLIENTVESLTRVPARVPERMV